MTPHVRYLIVRSLAWAAFGIVLVGCGHPVSATEPVQPVVARIATGQGLSGHVLVEPHDGDRNVVRALDSANHGIFVQAYILTNRVIIRALERAASQAVEVRVLLEHHPLGMGRQPETVADELRAAGVAVRWSNPDFALTHSKLLLIDDRRALISTANFSHSGFSSDRDFLLWDSLPHDVYALDAIFRGDWNRQQVHVDTPDLVISPLDARTKIETLLRRAKRSIDLYGEEMQDLRVERILVESACSGVRVRVILPSAPLGGSSIYRHGCVRVRAMPNPYAHAKAIVVDGRLGFLGSENVSTQSLDRNREVGVLTRGGAVRTILAVFGRDWQRALPAHPGER